MSAEAVAINVLSDESMLKILHLSSGDPVSLVELSNSCGITGAACFRRLSDLKRMGLIEELEGDSHFYHSSVKRIELQFREGHIYTVIEGGEGTVQSTCLDPLSGVSFPWNEGYQGVQVDYKPSSELISLF